MAKAKRFSESQHRLIMWLVLNQGNIQIGDRLRSAIYYRMAYLNGYISASIA